MAFISTEPKPKNMKDNHLPPKPFSTYVNKVAQLIQRLCLHPVSISSQYLCIHQPSPYKYLIYPRFYWNLEDMERVSKQIAEQSIVIISPSIPTPMRVQMRKEKVSYCSLEGEAFLFTSDLSMVLEQAVLPFKHHRYDGLAQYPASINRLTLNQVKVIEYLLSDEKLAPTHRAMAKRLDIPEYTISRILKQFVQAGWIKKHYLFIYQVLNERVMREMWLRDFVASYMPNLFRGYYSFTNERAKLKFEKHMIEYAGDFKRLRIFERHYLVGEKDGQYHLFTKLDPEELLNKYQLTLDEKGDIAIYRSF